MVSMLIHEILGQNTCAEKRVREWQKTEREGERDEGEKVLI